ncbi:ABC transporter ATP-binding protein [Mycoplasmopsis gallopavonis]|uniref:ABC-type multidrug/protein/lipid transport system ATPase component n=1 Tax=Mycoplasmopsis gallopavonis TaxID=76629 RepID=A0A449AZW0_9BACT|nr:ABC transporter ATP-binding protein [Mycoplasmopsis gallopavonis]VEU73050.1 ABC-type multidrug/protein/lipid transport system ATPase component [Mycoplasmopsis gallopavonis]
MTKTLKKKNSLDKTSFKRLFKFVWKENKVKYSIIFFLIILYNFVFAYSNYFFGTILINKYLVPFLTQIAVNSPNPSFDWKGFTLAISLIGLFYGLAIFSNYLSGQIITRITHQTIKKMRDNLYEHMQSLPIGYFDARQNGDVISRFTNDIDTLRELLSQSIPQIMNAIFSILFSLTFMIILSWFLTIIMLPLVFIIFGLSGYFIKSSGKYFNYRQASLGKLNGYINEMIDGIKVVKVFNPEFPSWKLFFIPFTLLLIYIVYKYNF